MAVITPTVFMNGKAELAAGIATAIAAYFRMPLLLVILVGMGSVVGLRFLF